MKRFIFALVLALSVVSPVSAVERLPPTTVPAVPQTVPERPSPPTGKGLPVVVRTGLFIQDVASIDEPSETFVATIDVRLRWDDSRVGFPLFQAPPGGVIDLRGEQAEARLAQMWAPSVAIANLVGDPTFQTRRLRISPEGRVELMQRTTGKFETAFDLSKFPFDRQNLTVELVERREPLHRLIFDFRQDDIEFSQTADSVSIDGWKPGLLHLQRSPQPAWYGEAQARVQASAEIRRDSVRTISVLFLPLLASLLIPLLALWLQRVNDGVILIETFELSNILIGGLFAVIALNFTLSATYPTLVTGDNTVTRLLGFNYFCLALNLLINVSMFRFNFVGRAFGKHVLDQSYRYLVWAMPVMVLTTVVSIMLLALV